MAEDNRSLNSAEKNNETSWYKSFGAGLASGIIKIPEGIVSLGAELIDLGADSDTAGDVEEFFDKINIFEDTAEERTIGKLTQAMMQIAVPGGIGFKVANTAARKLTTKALKARRKNLYASAGKGDKFYKADNPLTKGTSKGLKPLKSYDRRALREGLDKVNDLNRLSKYKRFGAAVTGGAIGETMVIDSEKIGTFGDMFEGPTELDRDTNYSGSKDAARKLMNRVKFGTESLLVTPFAYGVGTTIKTLAKRGKDLAYSSSKFERFINKYIREPFTPGGPLTKELFKSEVVKKGLKMKDAARAEELVDNITKAIDGVFPVAQEVADKTIKATNKTNFIKDINKILVDGDVGDVIDQQKLQDVFKKYQITNKNMIGKKKILSDNLNLAKGELNNLLEILNKTNKGGSKKAKAELKGLLEDRLVTYTDNTFDIFKNKSSIFNFFRKYRPTEEVYNKTVETFMKAGRTQQSSRDLIDDIIKQAQNADAPKKLPDFKYTDKTMESGKLKKEIIGLSDKATTTKNEKNALRELFGEVKDPRFTLLTAMTNLSSVARTSSYMDEILKTNEIVQAKGGKGSFWKNKEAAEAALDPLKKKIGIEYVTMKQILGEIDSTKNLTSPFSSEMVTTREIGEGLKFANDVVTGLQGFVRGDRKNAGAAEKTLSWFYRNLLLFPKGISQMAKTIFSLPTHIRNFMSAGAFSAANGIIPFLESPALIKKAFQQGINVSGLLKLGANSPVNQRTYQDMLELGLTNTQIQVADIAALFKATDSGVGMFGDNPLIRLMKKLKNVATNKYVAEDDTFKITNYVVELDRIVKAAAKKGRIVGGKRVPYKSVDDFKKDIGWKDDVLDGSTINKVTGVETRNEAVWALKNQAAEIVQNTVPNYAFVGEVVKVARLTPFGNFMSFPSEIIRTSSNIARQGVKEMTHSKPTIGSNIGYTVLEKQFPLDKVGISVKNDAVTFGTYGTGIKRLFGMATTLTAVPVAVTEGAMALYDVTEDEIDAMRRFVPDWSKNSTLVPVRMDDGELRYIDFSHSNAYDLMARPFRTIVRGVQEGQEDGDTLLEGFTNGAIQASGEIVNPFVSESIWTKAMADLISRGGRTEDGRQLYTDQTSTGDRLAIQIAHLSKSLAPNIKPFTRLAQAALELPDDRGNVGNINAEMAGFIGLRPIKIDPLQSMTYKITEYQRGIRNSRREFTGGFFGLLKGGPVSEQDIIERYIASNKARFEVQKEMFKNIDAAEILGESTSDLRKVFKERQISNKNFRTLLRGRFEPYYPSDDIRRKFRDIANGIGETNNFKGATGELRDLKNIFKNLDVENRFQSFATGGSVLPEGGADNLEKVMPVITQIKSDMEGLDLRDEFNVSVTDYITPPPQIVTPPLPPMPAPVVNQQRPPMVANNAQKPVTSNLTRTEQALLSPMEKVIAEKT